MKTYMSEYLALDPVFVSGGLPVLLFTLAAFCLLGFAAAVMRGRARGAALRPPASVFAILLLLLGLAALMVAVALKIA